MTALSSVRERDPRMPSAVTPWPPVMVYDANVLYPDFLRDVLLRLAVADLVAARWTAAIHDEWGRSLLRNRPDLPPNRVAMIRAKMDAALPEALVAGYEPLIQQIALPDPGDRHVVAAAVHAGATSVVTRNLKNFPVGVLAPLGIQAVSPDAFVGRLLDADFRTAVLTLERHRAGSCGG